MIYCSLEPGLLSLRGLSQHDSGTAAAVVFALGIHRALIRETNARIPLTDGMVVQILHDLESLAASDPAIQRSLRALVLEILSRGVVPAVVPTGLTAVDARPDIISGWVDSETRSLWVDTLAAAIVDLLVPAGADGGRHCLGIATWNREGLPLDVEVLIEDLPSLVEGISKTWKFPLLATIHDWCVLKAEEVGWPKSIPLLVEACARRTLGVRLDEMAHGRGFRFEPACLRDIAAEKSAHIRESLVEVLTRRAYDLLQARHSNERIRGQEGMWRLYVRKTAPPVRLHYFYQDDDIVYSAYTNSDHDRGL